MTDSTPDNQPALPAPDSGKPEDPKAGMEPRELTPEEQMERYEDALKEDDWGHQPC